MVQRTYTDQYADFKGRANRTQFWVPVLTVAIVGGILGGIVGGIAGMASRTYMIFMVIWSLIFIVPNLALGVRRMHDINRSGWSILLGLIPIVGMIILLVFWLKPSHPSSNQWGSVPTESL